MSFELTATKTRPSRRSFAVLATRAQSRRWRAAVGILVLLVAAALTLAPYVRHGGLSSDDWADQAEVQLHGFNNGVASFISLNPRRPLSAVYYAVVNLAFGGHQHWEIALGVGLWFAVSLLLFLILLELHMDVATTAACATLTLVFPFTNSVWLWPSASQASVSVALWLLGLLVMLRYARRSGLGGWPRPISAALYISSICVYEITLPAILITGALYFVKLPRRRAAIAWGQDLALVGLTALLFTSGLVHTLGTSRDHATQNLSGMIHHLSLLVSQGAALTGEALVPIVGAPRALVLALALVIATVNIVALHAVHSSSNPNLRRWLVLTAAGILLTIAGWIMLIPAVDYFSPLLPGEGNRINVVSALGLVMLLVGGTRLLTAGFARSSRGGRAAATLITVALAASVTIAYIHDSLAERGLYEQATRERMAVLHSLKARLPTLAPGTTVVVRGFDLYTAPDVPVFAVGWDLNGAVELLYHDPSLVAWPSQPVPAQFAAAYPLTCSPQGVLVPGISLSATPARYGRVLLFDAGSQTVTPITSFAACRRVAP